MSKFNFSGLIEKLKEKLGKGKSPPEIPEQKTQSSPAIPPSKNKGTSKDISSNQGLTRAFSPESRPFWQKIFIIALIASITYIFGSLIATKLVTIIVPKKAPLSFEARMTRDTTLSDLNTIKRINLFNAKDDKTKKKVVKKKEPEKEVPCETANRKSSLSLKLANTIVLQDRSKSMAFIEVSGKPVTGYWEKDKLNGLARIDKIGRLTVYIKNLRNRRCEYVTNLDEKLMAKKIQILAPDQGKKALQENVKKKIRVDGNKFYIKKSLKQDMLKNIGKVLTQARAIQIKNPDGSLAFKMVEIEPGSIYSMLNLSNGDIITKIDGKPIQNLNDIMSMFGRIKDISNLSLTVKRDGAEQVKDYNFEN
jgi:type II secretory pathway component PulC